MWAAARNPERGRAAAEEVRAHPWFSTSPTTNPSERQQRRSPANGGVLDVLINNAGISGGRVSGAELTGEKMQEVYDVNVFGAVRVLHAFLPLLERSAAPVVVNVSSSLRSIANSADPESTYSALVVPAYFSSRAALNMLTTQYAKAFPRMRINSVDPGFTGTDFNQNRGTQTVREGTDVIVQMATIGSDGPTATFVSRAGRVPW